MCMFEDSVDVFFGNGFQIDVRESDPESVAEAVAQWRERTRSPEVRERCKG